MFSTIQYNIIQYQFFFIWRTWDRSWSCGRSFLFSILYYMPNSNKTCKRIIKTLNSKLKSVKSQIDVFTNKTTKTLKKYYSVKGRPNKSKKQLILENKLQQQLIRDKRTFIQSQCDLMDSIQDLKNDFITNQCVPRNIASIKLKKKSIQVMNMMFPQEEQMLLYSELF
jgi:uncharacterized protein YoxC